MDINAFSQLGIGLATLLILWFVVKYFITALEKKDTYIEKIVGDFNTTMNNHIDHETEAWHDAKRAQEKTTLALGRLAKAITKLADKK